MKRHLERICVPGLKREGSVGQRVGLKSPVASGASLCMFSLNKPFYTEAIPEATMAVSIKKEKVQMALISC